MHQCASRTSYRQVPQLVGLTVRALPHGSYSDIMELRQRLLASNQTSADPCHIRTSDHNFSPDQTSIPELEPAQSVTGHRKQIKKRSRQFDGTSPLATRGPETESDYVRSVANMPRKKARGTNKALAAT